MAAKGLLIDITRCIGCGACNDACKEANGLPQDEKPAQKLDSRNYCVVQDKGNDKYVRRLCMHCLHPSCVSVCPVGAFTKTPEGPVTYDVDKCMGCRYCMVACPWGVPTYEWDNPVPRVRKCIMCADRVKVGKPTACAEACPAEATVFGDRDALLAEAKRRIAAEPAKYQNMVLGEKEVGGTSMLFLADMAFAQLGFPATLPEDELPQRTYAVISKIPGLVVVGGAFLMGMYWLTSRKNEVAKDAVIHWKGDKP
jgi:formate dehydrogenase iron-sulfur subunit